jgi:hypothetical protein
MTGAVMTRFQPRRKLAPALALLALALSAMGAGWTPQAAAQTAGDVQCDGCVDYTDLNPGSVTGYRIRNNSVRTQDIRDGTLEAQDFAPGAVAASLLKSTWIASPAGTPADNCAALKALLKEVDKAASAATPQAVWIEPGLYDCRPGGLEIRGNLTLRGESPVSTRIIAEENNIFEGSVQIQDLAVIVAAVAGNGFKLWENVWDVTFDSVYIGYDQSVITSGSIGIYLKDNNRGIVIRDSTLNFSGSPYSNGIWVLTGSDQVLVIDSSVSGDAGAISAWDNDLFILMTDALSGPVTWNSNTTVTCINSVNLGTLAILPSDCSGL